MFRKKEPPERLRTFSAEETEATGREMHDMDRFESYMWAQRTYDKALATLTQAQKVERMAFQNLEAVKKEFSKVGER